MAVAKIHDELISACRKNKHKKVSSLLLLPHLPVNQRNRDGDTAVMFAASSCHKETLEVLVGDPRVDLSVVNNYGESLEKMVGCVAGDADKKREALRIIRTERRKRDEQRQAERNRRREQERKEQENILRQIRQLSTGEEEVVDGGQVVEEEEVEKEIEETRELARSLFREKIETLKRQIGEDRRELNELQNSFDREEKELLEKFQREGTEISEQSRELEKLSEKQDEIRQKRQRMTRSVSSKELAVARLEMVLNQVAGPDQERKQPRELECPVCLEMMYPPARIWQCAANHLICGACRERIENYNCPTCRTQPIFGRAVSVEAIARTLFGPQTD